MSSKVLSRDITSYDLVKTFAVVIMVIDHVGAYFFPEQLWWRSIGRIGFPIWFFLVGHANSRDLPNKLLWGIGILTAGNVLAGMSVFPLNALVTIALIRLGIDHVMVFAMRSRMHLWCMSALLFLLALPTGEACEYGTMALITAMFGYFIRHRDTINDERLIFQFMMFALFAFVSLQFVLFGFSVAQALFMALGTALVRLSLYYFKPKSYPDLTRNMTSSLRWFFRVCGRRMLEI